MLLPVKAIREKELTDTGLLAQATYVPQETPLGAAARGAAAGLMATLLLSVLARIMPGMRNQPGTPGEREQGSSGKLLPPQDPSDRHQVRRWQAHAQSPAAYQQRAQEREQQQDGSEGAALRVTPAGVLAQAQSPGPEGLATQFAFKVAAGLFDRDITPHARQAGLAVHVAYGSTWGLLYGLLQASARWRPGLFGVIYGLVVWLVGPALLVPAMKLMRPPHEEPPLRTAMMVAGHIAYGAAVAAAFEALEREAA